MDPISLHSASTFRHFAESEDIREPMVFDRLKDQLTSEDKQAFLDLYFVETTDDILKCRKAELHIQLGTEKDDERAYRLLKDNPLPLARALIAQIYALQNDLPNVRRLLDEPLPTVSTLLDLEARCHLFRRHAWLLGLQGDTREAKKYCLRAMIIAESMELNYLHKVLRGSLKTLNDSLGILDDYEPLETGNMQLNRHANLSLYRGILLSGDLEKTTIELSPQLLTLANATWSRQKGQYRNIEGLIDGLSFDEFEHRLFYSLLYLEIYGRSALSNLKKLEPVKEFLLYGFKHDYIPEYDVIDISRKLYPLGCFLAGRLSQNFRTDIPILHNTIAYDGVWIGSEKVCGIPRRARSKIIRDQLNNGFSFSRLDKDTKYNTHQNLKKASLKLSEIICSELIYRAERLLL